MLKCILWTADYGAPAAVKYNAHCYKCVVLHSTLVSQSGSSGDIARYSRHLQMCCQSGMHGTPQTQQAHVTASLLTAVLTSDTTYLMMLIRKRWNSNTLLSYLYPQCLPRFCCLVHSNESCSMIAGIECLPLSRLCFCSSRFLQAMQHTKGMVNDTLSRTRGAANLSASKFDAGAQLCKQSNSIQAIPFAQGAAQIGFLSKLSSH